MHIGDRGLIEKVVEVLLALLPAPRSPGGLLPDPALGLFQVGYLLRSQSHLHLIRNQRRRFREHLRLGWGS